MTPSNQPPRVEVKSVAILYRIYIYYFYEIFVPYFFYKADTEDKSMMSKEGSNRLVFVGVACEVRLGVDLFDIYSYSALCYVKMS